MMDTRIGTTGVLRLVWVALTAVSLLLITTLATPTQADAHSVPGVTKIYVDGELVLRTPDDHLTYTQELSAGCHEVKVVRSSSESTSPFKFVTKQTECSTQGSTLVVDVNDNSVSVYTIAATTPVESQSA